MMKRKDPTRLADQLRKAIDAAKRTRKLSRYAICKEIGLPESTMSRFMNGYSGLQLNKIERLADLLGLNIVSEGQARRAGKAARQGPGPSPKTKGK